MYAHRVERDGGVVYEHLDPDRRYAESHKLDYPIVEVTVAEGEDGPYYGWVDTDEQVPTMIHAHRILFSMCFPYGVQAEVDAGKGRVVRLTVEEAS